MKRPRFYYGFIIISLIVIGGIYVWQFSFKTSNRDQSNRSHNHSHSHKNRKPVPASKPPPTLEISLEQTEGDKILHLDTKNFSFQSPANSSENQTNTGHAHLFVDGESIAMFYKNQYVLPGFMPGNYKLKVTLNQHGTHAPLSVNNNIISDTLGLTIKQR